MEAFVVESEKYIIRPVEEKDFEDIKVLLKENEYLGMLWSVPLLSEDRLDDLVRSLYIVMDRNYCVVDKTTNEFCGHMSILHEGREGEFSVRMRKHVDMYEVVELFGKVLKQIGPVEEKNLTMQYSFE